MEPTIESIAAEIRLKSSNISFLSEVDLLDETMAYLRENIDDILRRRENTDDLCIVKAFVLVDIGCRLYQEKTYWPFVAQERDRTSRYGKIGSLSNDEKEDCRASFSRGLDALGLRNDFNTYRSIDNILIHSFVPYDKTDDFFFFVYRFYEKTLGFTLDNLDAGFKTLSDFMTDYVKDRASTDKEVPYPNKLLKCTQYALCDEELFRPLMEKFIRIVDSIINNRAADVDRSNRYVIAFQEWFEKYTHRVGLKNIRNDYHRRGKLRLGESDELLMYIPRRKCNQNDRLTVEWNDKEYKPDQPSYRIQSGSIYADKMTFDLGRLCPGITAFDCFSVRLGDCLVYERKTNRDYIMFNDEGDEIEELSEGYVTILLKDAIEVGPKDKIASRGKTSVQIQVSEGDVFYIGNHIVCAEHDASCPLNEMEIDYLDGIAADIDGTLYPVTASEIIRFNTTLSGGSKFIMRAKNSESKIIERLIEPKWKDEYGCQLEIKLSDYFEKPELLSLDIRENNTRSLCKSTFAYVPNLNPEFDKEFYLKEKQGTLSLGNYGKLEFTTDCETVSQPIQLKNLDADLIISIPSIWIKFDDNQWIRPEEHDYSILDFCWDRISIKSNLKRSIRLYTNVPKVGLEPEIKSDSISFNLCEMRNRIENLVENKQSDYLISISINSNKKCDLIRIIVHNIYKFEKSCRVIKCIDQAKLHAEYILKRDKIILHRESLNPGLNYLHSDNERGVTLTINEQNPYTGQINIPMLSEILGSDTYVYNDGQYLHFVYKNKEKMFPADKSLEFLIGDYDQKSRFSPWMKKSEAKSAFKREYAKWKNGLEQSGMPK